MFENIDEIVRRKKVWIVSRFVLYTSILLMVSSSMVSKRMENLLLGKILFTVGIISFTTHWMIPVFLLLAKKQGFAVAWYGGLVSWTRVRAIEVNDLPAKVKVQMFLNFATFCGFLVVVLLLLGLTWSSR